MLDALALLLERQPARSVVQLGCVRQVYQHLENREEGGAETGRNYGM